MRPAVPWLFVLVLTAVNCRRAGLCFLCLTYTYFRVPEPRNRSFFELDVLFANGVSARKFHKTHVDEYGNISHIQGAGKLGAVRNRLSIGSKDEKSTVKGDGGSGSIEHKETV